MIKKMFIADIEEINDSFIGIICQGELSKTRFAEDNFGNFAIIEDDGSIVAYMLDYEKEEYKLAESKEDFYRKYTLYDIDEVYDILNKRRKHIKDEHDIIIDLYKAKAVIGKDFIDLTYVVDDNKYNATSAYNHGKISKDELKKLEVFYPKYLKEANKVNKEKHNRELKDDN